MSEEEDDEEYFGPRQPLVYVTFEDDEGEEIVEFSGLNVPAPSEGEEITLTEMELHSDYDENDVGVESEDEASEYFEQTSTNYVVRSVSSQYVSLPDMYTSGGSENTFNAPMINKSVTVEQAEDSKEEEQE
jgi:hypothetical protein